MFPQDYYPAPRLLDPTHVDAYQAQAADIAGEWRRRVADGTIPGGATPAARLHATLLLRQLEELGTELRRTHDAAQAAMDGLRSSMYGFMGFPCCSPKA